MIEAMAGLILLMLCSLGWGYRDLNKCKADRSEVNIFKRAVEEDVKEIKGDVKETIVILTDMRIEAAKNNAIK